jgi:hypothetical protein
MLCRYLASHDLNGMIHNTIQKMNKQRTNKWPSMMLISCYELGYLPQICALIFPALFIRHACTKHNIHLLSLHLSIHRALVSKDAKLRAAQFSPIASLSPLPIHTPTSPLQFLALHCQKLTQPLQRLLRLRRRQMLHRLQQMRRNLLIQIYARRTAMRNWLCRR